MLRLFALLLLVCHASGFNFPLLRSNFIALNSHTQARSLAVCLQMSTDTQKSPMQKTPMHRADFLRFAGVSAGSALLADTASARGGGGGEWARRYGEFEEEELAGFVEMAPGLKIKDIVEGTGASPQKGQMVITQYAGYLLSNGQMFDSSYEKSRSFKFKLGAGQVIKGWDTSLQTMKVGGKRMVVIPPELAYGKRGAGQGIIPPDATLVFYVELVGIGA